MNTYSSIKKIYSLPSVCEKCICSYISYPEHVCEKCISYCSNTERRILRLWVYIQCCGSILSACA